MLITVIWCGILFCWISKQFYNAQQRHTEHRSLLLFAVFYISHYVMILVNRWNIIGVMAVYEGLWVCSLALPLASLGIVLKRYHLVAAAVSSVLTGHIIWFVDTLIMISLRDFRRTDNTLGIADYGDASGKITPFSFWCETHHIWFIPTTLWILYQTKTKYRPQEVAHGYVWVLCLSAFTVLVMPQPCIPVDGRCLISNVNMVRSWWGVESLKFLHLFDYQDGHTTFFMSWGWNNFWYFCLNLVLYSVGAALFHLFGRGQSSDMVTMAPDGKTKKERQNQSAKKKKKN